MSDAHTTLEVTDSSDPACAVSLQTQFEYDSYPYQTTHSDARCVVSVRAQDRELARAPIDLCAVIDRCCLLFAKSPQPALDSVSNCLATPACAGQEACGEASSTLSNKL